MTKSSEREMQKVLEETVKKARDVFGGMQFGGGFDMAKLFPGGLIHHNACGFEYFVSAKPDPVPECPVCFGKWIEWSDELKRQKINSFYQSEDAFIARLTKDLRKSNSKSKWRVKPRRSPSEWTDSVKI